MALHVRVGLHGRIGLLALVVVLGGGLTGCADDGGEDARPSEEASRDSGTPVSESEDANRRSSAAQTGTSPSGGEPGQGTGGQSTNETPTGSPDDECPCGPRDCFASDDDPCAEGTGICAEGICQPVGELEALAWHDAGYWVSSLRVTPSGGLVASAAERVGEEDEEPEVRIFDGDLDEIAHFPGATAVDLASHEQGLFALAFEDARVELRHLAESEAREVWDGYGGPVRFSPDGAYLAMSSADGVRLQPLPGGPDVEPGEPADFAHPETRNARLWVLEFSADGALLALGRGASGFGSPVGDVRVFDVASGEQLRTFDCPATSGSFSPDATRIAVACWNSGDLFSVDAGSPAVRLDAPDLAQGLHWLDVPGQGSVLVFGSYVGQVRLLQQQDNGWETRAAIELPAVRKAVALPDGSLLLAPWSDAGPLRWIPHFRLQETP